MLNRFLFFDESSPIGGMLLGLGFLFVSIFLSSAITACLQYLFLFCYPQTIAVGLIIVLGHHGIAPHFFELVKFSGFGQHDMHHYVYIIDQNPLLGLAAFMFIRGFSALYLYVLFYKVCNGF